MPPVNSEASLVKNLARGQLGSKKSRTFLYDCEWNDEACFWESTNALDQDPFYPHFLRLHPESEKLHLLCSLSF